jgi:hypothetical protein
MSRESLNLDDKTKTPIGWLVAVVAAAFALLSASGGVILWGARLEAKTEAHDAGITKLEVKQERYDTDMRQVRDSLIEIKSALKIKN